jgi:hypothetical protein
MTLIYIIAAIGVLIIIVIAVILILRRFRPTEYDYSESMGEERVIELAPRPSFATMDFAFMSYAQDIGLTDNAVGSIFETQADEQCPPVSSHNQPFF